MLSREKPLMSLLQSKPPGKNSQYKELFKEAGVTDIGDFSFQKVGGDEGGIATLEISLLEPVEPEKKEKKEKKENKPRYDTRWNNFENWLRNELHLEPNNPLPGITKVEPSIVPSLNKITYRFSHTELEKIDENMHIRNISKKKKVEAAVIQHPTKAKAKNEIGGWVASRFNIGEPGEYSTVAILNPTAGKPKIIKIREQEESKFQKSFDAYDQQQSIARETALRQEQQSQLEQRKLQEETEEVKENEKLFYNFFENPQTKIEMQTEAKIELQATIQACYNWNPNNDQIQFEPDREHKKVICKIVSQEGTLIKQIHDLDKWIEDEESRNEKIVNDLRTHFTKYRDYLQEKRSYLDLGRYFLTDSGTKLRIVEALLEKLEKPEKQTHTELVNVFREYFATETIEQKLKTDRYKSGAVSFTVFIFKQLIPSFIYSEEQAKTEGEKIVTDKKVTDIIKPPGMRR